MPLCQHCRVACDCQTEGRRLVPSSWPLEETLFRWQSYAHEELGARRLVQTGFDRCQQQRQDVTPSALHRVKFPGWPNEHHRCRFQNEDSPHRQQAMQGASVGHCWLRTLPFRVPSLLSKLSWLHRRLRRDKQGVLRCHH